MITPQYISSSRNTLRDVMEPRDAPDLSKYRVVDMFHRHTCKIKYHLCVHCHQF